MQPISYLESKKEINWQVERSSQTSSEIYLIQDKTEAIRTNRVENYNITLNLAPKNNTMGESSLEFDSLPENWRTLIDDSIEMAAYVKNPPYELSTPWTPGPESTSHTYDPTIGSMSKELLLKTAETVNRFAEKYKGKVFLSYLEAHLKNRVIQKTNSKGLKLEYPQTEILYDFSILTKDKEHESQSFIQRNFFQDLPLFHLLEQESEYLNDIARAKLPPTGVFPVVLGDEALDTLFNFHAHQLKGETLYQNISLWQREDNIYNKKAAEPLTLISSPNITGCEASICADELGYPTKEITLIQDGIVREFAISGKMAGLLGQKPTSLYTNTVVQTGNTPYNDFLTNGVFELLRFSTFSPDPITGNFSGEIRLGYHYKNGEKIPIKQGSVSGNIKDAASCLFSKEKTVRRKYAGPKGVFFDGLTLAGDL